MYGLNPKQITYILQRLGWKNERREAIKNLKRKLIFQITGKEASEKDLNKAFIDIFTKEFIEDLLKRNGYCCAKCAAELDNIDPKCIYEAITKFNIEIPLEIKEDIMNLV